MSKRRVILNFTPETSSQPIIYNLGQQFNIVTNISQAEAREDRGWIALDLDGNDNDIEAGITWVISRGVRIEPVGE
jgi:ABC-type methionine transport system ATPase subunit